MILLWLILVLLIGGFLAWLLGRWQPFLSRLVSLLALLIDLILVLRLWWLQPSEQALSDIGDNLWLVELNLPWIPQFGISFHLALDGLSLLMIALTVFLGFMAVLTSWTEVVERVGFFHFNLMWILAGVIGVFLALDLFLFYFFWELMLAPMYFLIAIWGHENRAHAALKFFLYTQFSGLLMLAAILGLYLIHGQSTGQYTFNYEQLLGATLQPATALWLMSGFLIAFLVKLPAAPVHNWLPDAHTEAPTAGSLILAGLLLKTGAYGLLRFVVPLFPDASVSIAPYAMLLGALGILYGAILAFAQTDLKRLVAYTSVSHMGFVLLGVFALNKLAWQGVVMQMISHGISTGTLFIIVGMLQERIHTRDITRMGGLWAVAPRMGGVALVFAMASLGLPGLGNFVGEIMVLMGASLADAEITVLATVGLILATIYALRIIQQTFHGPNRAGWQLPDLSGREMGMMAAMIVVIVWLGLYPQPFIRTADRSLETLLTAGESSTASLIKPNDGNPIPMSILAQRELVNPYSHSGAFIQYKTEAAGNLAGTITMLKISPTGRNGLIEQLRHRLDQGGNR